MKTKIRKILMSIPSEYKEAFSREIDRENLFRMVAVSGLLLISETAIILFLKEHVLNTGGVVMDFIVFILVSLPILYFVYSQVDKIKMHIVKIVQSTFLLGILLFGIALALVPQSELISIHIYIITVYGIAAFIYLMPVESALLFGGAFLIFFFLLPYYQQNPDVLMILRVNALIMNITAWILSRMVIGMRVRSFIDKRLIMKKNRQLRRMAQCDSMTMLLNHENIYMRLCEEIDKAKHTKCPLSIIMIDIDDFKIINDTYGHLVGDKVIVQVAEIIVRTCRATDYVGRYGGEEFIVILPETNHAEAFSLAERLRASIEKNCFETSDNITISGGVAEYTGQTPEELIMMADQNHYSAKNSGKNRIRTHNVIN